MNLIFLICWRTASSSALFVFMKHLVVSGSVTPPHNISRMRVSVPRTGRPCLDVALLHLSISFRMRRERRLSTRTPTSFFPV